MLRYFCVSFVVLLHKVTAEGMEEDNVPESVAVRSTASGGGCGTTASKATNSLM